ncbi:fam-l protein [Plasmodium malariae]|uniref:Fam-l protein n=1 Tax=Plasmodium malariae TaxID=5858 RepID=A0A1D3JI35_PLAMA|nr:fam-l protein [Plasmodium malariae]SBT86072.1 fam-l protein [Plasmodium malariae]
MEQKNKTLSFIKFVTFVLLSWIFHFHTYVSTHEKSLNECYNNRKKLYTRYFRLLAKYKQVKDSSIVCLKEDIPNGDNDKKDIFSNEKRNTETMKQSNGNPLYNVKGHKQSMKNKTCIFETKKYSHLEKKIFKELDYEDFLRNNRTISNKVYKKIILKKYGLRLILPVLFFLLLLIPIILDLSGHFALVDTFYNVLKTNFGDSLINPLKKLLWESPFCWLGSILKEAKTKKEQSFIVIPFFTSIIYFLPLFILGVTIVLRIVYYHKKVKKYERIKFKKR